MKIIRTEVSQIIQAPAEEIYQILRDYEVGHPAILPPKYFKELIVLEGGQGAGTVIRVKIRVFGGTETFTLSVSEPLPNRHLMEEDPSRRVSTSFLLEPGRNGTKVSILSMAYSSGGISGFFEAWLIPRVNKKIFKEELRLLEKYVLEKKNSNSQDFYE